MKRNLSIDGFATPSDTRAFADRAIGQGVLSSHFRVFDGLTLSRLGMGTYLGEPNKETDALVSRAIQESVKSGAVNSLDTAINYRFQKAERSIREALKKLVGEGVAKRSEIFLATKNGYLTHDGDLKVDFWKYVHEQLVKPGVIKPQEISSGMHCISVNYLRDQLQRSLQNLGVECIDLMYIHNAAESQIPDIGKEEFISKLRSAFEFYEDIRQDERIRYYGLATWTCFRVPYKYPEYLSLQEVVSIAEQAGGQNHGFRFIQLPFNIALSEALLLKNQQVGAEWLSTLEAATKLGIGVFTSVPLMQGRLLNQEILTELEGIDKPALRCLQIVRSTPYVIAPLIGQKDPIHVQENMQLARLPLIGSDQVLGLFSKPAI